MSTSFLLPLELPHPEVALRDAESGSEEARWVAALTLGRVSGPMQEDALKALFCLAEDTAEEVRAQALESIAEQARGGGVRVPEKVAQKALLDPSAGVRCAAIDTALEILSDSASTIVKCIKDEDPSVRAASAQALGFIAASDKADQLVELLDDPDGFVRRQSAIGLAYLGDTRGESVLISWLETGSDDGCEPVFALGTLGSKTALPQLKKIATSRFSNIELKSMSAAAMVRCDDQHGREILLQLLGARRERTRMAVLGTLARLPIPGVAAKVSSLLDDGHIIEASSAIQTLIALADVDPGVVRAELEKRVGRLTTELDEELKEALSSLGRAV